MIDDPTAPPPVSSTDLADLVTHSADGALVLDSRGFVRYANPAALGLFMRSLRELRQVPLGLLQDGADIDVMRPDGSVRIAEVRLSKTQWQDAPMSLVSLRDVTERRGREDLAHEAQREAERVAEKSAAMLLQSQKLDALGKLTGGIAHDFNNLLSILVGSLQLLTRHLPMSKTAERQLEICRRAVKRGTDLTSRLLAFSRLQHLDPRPVPLAPLFSETVGFMRTSIEENITLEAQLETDDLTVFCDEAELQAALVNIVLNARDALAGRSSGCITLSAQTLRSAAEDVSDESAECVEITIADDGAGMSEEVRQHAFEPFISDKEDGTGLGLAMVYGFVTQSGGDLNVDSAPGVGTCVRMTLPAAREIERPAQQDAAAAGRGETILVVEDEPDLLEVAVQMLKHLGYKTRAAGSGPPALAILRSEPQIDLLLTDVVMPGGMTGVELYDAAMEVRADLPVLFVSGHAAAALREIESRSMPFLPKPYTSATLAKAVTRALAGAGTNGSRLVRRSPIETVSNATRTAGEEFTPK